MQAQYYQPEKLKGLVHSIWKQKADRPMNWQILPSGKVELIFMISSPVTELEGKRVGNGFNPTEYFCFLSGLHTKPLYLSFPRFENFGVQMDPLAVKAFFGIPCSEVKDWALKGEDVLEEIERIRDRLKGAGTFLDKARWIEDFLFDKIDAGTHLRTAIKMKDVVGEMCQRLSRGQSVSVEQYTGYSRAHTHRLFREWFGLSGHQCLRLQQFIRSMRSLHFGGGRLTDIGMQNGYYDQSHFIRSFKKFSGMTPGTYVKNKSELFGQLPHA